MRGSDRRSGSLFSDVDLEARVRADHPLRAIRRSAIDGRTTRHPGYGMSQRIRKRIEEGFGWSTTVAGQRKTRFRGRDKGGWAQVEPDASLTGEIHFHNGDNIAFMVRPWATSSTRC